MAKDLAIVIRAYDENTVDTLSRQLNRQKNVSDELVILNDHVPFETKLRLSYEKALELDKEFTLIIDADILVTHRFLEIIKHNITRLNNKDFGFGLKLLDRFYGELKFRGVHVYRTSLLAKAISFIPSEGETLRPETMVKSNMSNSGYSWRNDIYRRAVGLHDYFQKPEDIFYKQFIRAARSKGDFEKLTKKYTAGANTDFFWAIEGLNAGLKFTGNFSNNKDTIIKSHFNGRYKNLTVCKKPAENINWFYFTEMVKKLGVKAAIRNTLENEFPNILKIKRQLRASKGF